MHRKFQLHTKKAELFNIIWKLHPSCDSATLQQYSWASCSLVQFPGNLCVLWCLAWEKSHHKHQRGSVLALGLWPGCLRTFQLSFHTHSDLPAALLGSTTLQRQQLSSHRAALQEPGEQRDPLWSWLEQEGESTPWQRCRGDGQTAASLAGGKAEPPREPEMAGRLHKAALAGSKRAAKGKIV